MTHGLDDLFSMTEPHEGPMIKQAPALAKSALTCQGPKYRRFWLDEGKVLMSKDFHGSPRSPTAGRTVIF